MAIDGKALVDVQRSLWEKLGRASAELDRLRSSLGGGAKKQARIIRLVKECDRIAAALARVQDASGPLVCCPPSPDEQERLAREEPGHVRKVED